MSGQRIDDHSFWGGGMSKDSVLPMGAKSKSESGEEGAGAVSRYEDTAEAIRSQQKAGVSRIKSNPMAFPNRN